MSANQIKHAFFIGDVHLDTRRPDRTDSFHGLLDHVIEKQPDHLFLIGDIFEFWFGYKTVMFSKYLTTIVKFSNIINQGIPITYMTGNHDFCLGPVFKNILRINVEHKPLRLHFGNCKVYISHGDEINTADWKYRLIRSILRCPLTQFLFRCFVPAGIAWYLGRGTSDSSRKFSGEKDRPIPEDVFETFCAREAQRGVNVVIHGHNHDPGTRKWSHGEDALTIMDCGDWLREQGHYIEFRDGEFIPGKWSI